MNVDNVTARLRRRKIQGSQAVALETALLLRHVVSTFKWSHIDQLLVHLKRVGRRLVAAQPREFAAGNIVRRVLKVIREEYADEVAALQHGRASRGSDRREEDNAADQDGSDAGREDSEEDDDVSVVDSGTDEAEGAMEEAATFDRGRSTRAPASGAVYDPNTAIHSSILNLLGRPVNEKSTLQAIPTAAERAAAGADLKPALIAALQLVIDEVRKGYADIAGHALDYIHGGEVVLTHGAHPLAVAFLRQAAEKRQFTVIMTESSPNETTSVHRAAQTLLSTKPSTGSGCSVVVVPDSACFALMPRCNKVILAPGAVLQNGGLLIAPGAKSVCLAARHHAVPVVALAASHDLAPIYPYGQGRTASTTFKIGSHHGEAEAANTRVIPSVGELLELNSPQQILPLQASSTIAALHRPAEPERDVEDFSEDDIHIESRKSAMSRSRVLLGGLDDVIVLNPAAEYVEPDFVDLYVTNLGGHAPTALDRLLSDNYDEEDREL